MPLAHEEVGTGKPVVLLHGFPPDRGMWRPQLMGLARKCHLLVPDLPGFGDSALLPGTPTMEAMADAVAQWLDHLHMKEKVVLGGLSMGGYVSFAFARKYPDRLRGLILADTRAEADDDVARANRDRMIGFASTNPAAAVIEQMIPRLVGSSTLSSKPELVEEVRHMGSRQRPAGILAALQALRNRPDSIPTLTLIQVPTLILVGQEDVLTPPSVAEIMRSKIAKARLVELPRAGHMANLEAPDPFNEAVSEFIDSL